MTQRKRIYQGFSSTINGNIKTVYDVEAVKRCLFNHFNTKKNERMGDPSYGTIVWDLLFELNDDNTRYRIKEEVQRIIDSEPRVETKSLELSYTDHSVTVSAILFYRGLDVQSDFTFIFDTQLQSRINGGDQ